jgi:hypothetical protein
VSKRSAPPSAENRTVWSHASTSNSQFRLLKLPRTRAALGVAV